MTEMEISHSPNRGKDRLPIIVSFARDYEQIWREERGSTVEAEVVRALIQARDLVKGGKLALKEFKDILNLDRPEGEKFSSKSVGGFLTSLGFKKTRAGGGAAAIVFDHHVLKSRARQFGLLDELEKTEIKQPLSVEKLDEGITVEFLIDIDTSDVNLSNQPVFERFLGKGKKFTKGQRCAIDQEAANVLSMMGYCKIIERR
jgi:hypothetical protein